MRISPWLFVGLLISTPGSANDPSPPAETIIVRQPATIDQEEAIERAARAFETAGLTLPPVEVVFSNDERHCKGHLGLFQPARKPWRISICSELAFVPTHELAHAWIEANVDEETRTAYVQLRRKRSWNSPKHHWNERGVEDAAFVIQQNLTAQPQGDLNDEWEQRASTFELLVGAPSPLRNTTPTEDCRRPRGYPTQFHLQRGVLSRIA